MENLSKKPTIKDIAIRANVSTATVSRVLNNNDSVKPALAKRVQDAIDELHFIPNNVAKNLKTSSGSFISFIISDISNNYFTTMADMIQRSISSEGYTLIMFSSGGNPALEANFLNYSIANNAAGVIVNTAGGNDALIARISQNIPVVTISRKVNHPDYLGDFIDGNSFEGAYKLADHIISNGHTRIAIINGNQELSTGIERNKGFMACANNRGIHIPSEYIYYGDFTQKSGFLATEYFLSLPVIPTAVVAMNNSMAIGAIECFINKGVKVPQEVSLASYGDINNLKLLSIQPSYVSLNPYTIGEKAAELILQRISNGRKAMAECIFEPKLFECSGVSNLINV